MSTIYQVVETETGEEQNFYDTSLPQALSWAKDCKRQLKSMTGKEYDILVKKEDGTQLSLKEYAN